jgi:hypothetical protein
LSNYWRRYKDRLSLDYNKLQDQIKANSLEEEWTRMAEILEKVEISAKDRYNNKQKTKPKPQAGKDAEDSSKDTNGKGKRRPYSKQHNN